MAYYIKPATPAKQRYTQNSGGTTEHQQNTPEQRNLTRRRIIAFMRYYKLKFNENLEIILNKAARNVNAF